MSTSPRDPASTALARLNLSTGPRAGLELPVRTPVATIGTGAQADLVLEDDSVSKSHARLEYAPAGWQLTDLGSINGTFVDDLRLQPSAPAPLRDGARVRLGAVALEFHADPAADPAALAARPPERAAAPAPRRSGFRLPVWLFLLILIVLGLVTFFVLDGPDPTAPDGAPDAPSVEQPATAGP